LPDTFSLRACHSLNSSQASSLYFNMYSSVCLVASLMKSSIFQPPPMAVSSGPHRSEGCSCSGSVAREFVFGVKGFLVNLHLMQLSQSHLPVILGASVIISKVSKTFRLTCARRRCHNIRFSVSCRDAYPVVVSGSRQQSSISVDLVDPGAQSRTPSRKNSPST
jgi:hypothetical protein